MRSITFTGKHLRLVLGVAGYEFETASNSDDDNWLAGSVELELGLPPEQVLVKEFGVFWQTTELRDFERELRAALAKQRSRFAGNATLTTLEDQLELEVMVRRDEATIAGRVDQHPIASIEFAQLPTSAEELERALAELAEVTGQFPVRP